MKIYSSEKLMAEDDGWQHERIVLMPLNPEYQSVVLEPESEGDVAVIAEFVQVIK